MTDVSHQRSLLHGRLEAHFEERRQYFLESLRHLDRELVEGHEWIESAPDSIIAAIVQTGGSIPIGGGNVASSRDTDRIRLYDPIREIIETIDPEYSISSIVIHDALMQKIPALEFEDQRKLKARIAATLAKIADEGFLRLVKKGSGSAPHKYRIVESGHQPLMEAVLNADSVTKS